MCKQILILYKIFNVQFTEIKLLIPFISMQVTVVNALYCQVEENVFVLYFHTTSACQTTPQDHYMHVCPILEQNRCMSRF